MPLTRSERELESMSERGESLRSVYDLPKEGMHDDGGGFKHEDETERVSDL